MILYSKINNGLIIQFGKFHHLDIVGVQTVTLNTSYNTFYLVFTSCTYASRADEVRSATVTVHNMSEFGMKACWSFGGGTEEYDGIISWLTIGC